MNDNILKFQWLGTAGFRFYFRNKIILLDPYITRVKDRETPIDSNPEYIKKYIDKADYIIVSHSHYDHFADTPTIAKMTNAEIIGSETTVNISKSFGVSEKQLTIVKKYDSLKFDEFEVTFLPSLHGTNSENKVPFPGYVTKPESTPIFASDFKEGGTFAPLIKFGNKSILQIGSANFIEEVLKEINIDILLVCIAWREKIENFLQKLIELTNPKIVIPIHFDNYWTPLEKGMIYRTDTSISEFYKEMKQIKKNVEIVQLDFFEDYIINTN